MEECREWTFQSLRVTVCEIDGSLSGHEVARLAQFEEQSKAFPLWVRECTARWEMLGRPHKPLKPERIAESQAAYKQGEVNPSPMSSPGWGKAGLWSRNRFMRRLIIWSGISRSIGACGLTHDQSVRSCFNADDNRNI